MDPYASAERYSKATHIVSEEMDWRQLLPIALLSFPVGGRDCRVPGTEDRWDTDGGTNEYNPRHRSRPASFREVGG